MNLPRSSAELLDQALSLAERLAQRPRQALFETKRLSRERRVQPLP